MKLIPLTQGKFAQVDDEDYDYLMQWKWHARKDGSRWYAARGYGSYKSRSCFHMHWAVLKITKREPGIVTDHINHDGLDNRKRNLRRCTEKQNARNRSRRKTSPHKYKGVTQDKRFVGRNWRATLNGKIFGYFYTEEEAAKAYDIAAKIKYGEFANLNFK